MARSSSIPTYSEMRESLLNIMVVGTADGIVMIESGAKEVKEETVVDAIEFAHTEIKKICAAINDLRQKGGQAEAPGHSSRVRPGLLRRSEERSWRRPQRPPRHPEASQGGKLHSGPRDSKKDCRRPFRQKTKPRRRNSRPTSRPCANASSANRLSTRSAVPTAAPSTRFAISGSKSASCPAPTDPPSSPAAKPRPWSPPPWAPATTCSASKSSKAKPKNASCSTTTSRRFRLEKLAFLRGAGRREIGHGALAERSISNVLPGEDELALCHARRLRHPGVERFIFDGHGLRSLVVADGCWRSAEVPGRRRCHGPGEGRRQLRHPDRHRRR